MKSTTVFQIIFLSSLFLGLIVITGCEEDIENKDPENINVDPEQRRNILQERHNITDRGNPIFEADLEATNPSRGETNAGGYVTLVLQSDSIHIKGEFSGLSSPYTSSYIHEVLQSDRVQLLEPSLNENETSGTWEATYEFDEEMVKKLNEDSLYISVYSENFPDEGELRAQLVNWDSVAVASPNEKQQ